VAINETLHDSRYSAEEELLHLDKIR